MEKVPLPPELVEKSERMEREAYSHLVAGNFAQAENIYREQYLLFESEEQKLRANQKYHKGGPLHNWGISLLFQNRLLEGFNKITLAYIEDLLDFPTIEEAFNAPAYKTLKSYPLISGEFLVSIKEIAENRRRERSEPRNPQEILDSLHTAGVPDLSSKLTPEETTKTPMTIKQMREIIKGILEGGGTKKRRVFVGGNYKNIALLRYIKSLVEEIDDFKGILPIDLPTLSSDKFDHLIHDMSIECLKNCAYAIFEVSVSDGHLMEIEWANSRKALRNRILLVYQQTAPNAKPPITRMVLTTRLKKWSYKDFKELQQKIRQFLGK
jgi:hypothetical protein